MPPEADERIIATRLANALYPEARINDATESVTRTIGLFNSIKWSTGLVARYHGGYWVGGRATLTDHSLLFAPNGMNRALQDGIDDVEIALRDITGVGWRWGVLTGIIDIAMPGEMFSIRCFNAKSFAAAIEAAQRSA